MKYFNRLGTTGKVILGVVLLLVVVRIFLPAGMKYAINWYLGNKMESYEGRIEDFDLALYRGAYQIEGLKIWKKGTGPEQALISTNQLDLSIAWRGILKKEFLGDLSIHGAKISLSDSKDEKKEDLGQGQDWQTVFKKLIPITLESVKIADSSFHFLNRDFKVPVDVKIDRIEGRIDNIRNTEDNKDPLPTRAAVVARMQGHADVKGKARLNLLSKVPSFDTDAQLQNLKLQTLNDFFMAYGPFTFTKGQFSLYVESVSRDGRIKGYAKPFIKDLDVIDDKESFKSMGRAFNEVGLALVNLILRDGDTKTLGARIEFEGASKAPSIDKWGAFWSSVQNGFFEAIKQSLEHSISPKDLKKQKSP